MYRHSAFAAESGFLPHGLIQSLGGINFAGMLHQELQNAVLRRSQSSGYTFYRHGFGPVIQGDAADGDFVRLFSGMAAQLGKPAQLGTNPGKYLHRHKGLGDVIIGAYVQTEDHVLGFGLGGEQNDGDVGNFPDFCGGGNAVHHRHHNVQQHQMDLLIPNQFQGLGAVGGLVKTVPFRGQIDPQGTDDIRLVIANQNVVHGSYPLFDRSDGIIALHSLR